jgi:hypothetical protein
MRDLIDKLRLLEATDSFSDKEKEERYQKWKAEQEKKDKPPAPAIVKPADNKPPKENPHDGQAGTTPTANSDKKDKDNTSAVAPVEPDKKDNKYKDNAGKIDTVNGPITSSSGNWVNWGPQSDNPGFDLWINDVTNQQMFRKKKYF